MQGHSWKGKISLQEGANSTTDNVLDIWSRGTPRKAGARARQLRRKQSPAFFGSPTRRFDNTLRHDHDIDSTIPSTHPILPEHFPDNTRSSISQWQEEKVRDLLVRVAHAGGHWSDTTFLQAKPVVRPAGRLVATAVRRRSRTRRRLVSRYVSRNAQVGGRTSDGARVAKRLSPAQRIHDNH